MTEPKSPGHVGPDTRTDAEEESRMRFRDEAPIIHGSGLQTRTPICVVT